MHMFAVEVVAALAPAIALLVWIYRKDKLEREPWSLIGLCFICGVISVVPAILLENAVDTPLLKIAGGENMLYYVLSNFIGIALIEELCKLWATFRAWKKRDFNCTFDGIVYGIAAALGFAALENICYVLISDNSLEVALERAILSVPGHMCYGMLMGLFIGRAKEAMTMGKPHVGLIVLGVLIATCAHGLFDFLITIDQVIPWLATIVVLYVIVFWQTGKAQKADHQFLDDPEGKQRVDHLDNQLDNPPLNNKF